MPRSRRTGGAKPRISRYARSPYPAAGSGGFNPLTYGSPLIASWAEDPDWTPPADGGAVGSWPNRGSVTGDWTEATNRPVYDADGLGGKPALVFDATNDILTFDGTLAVDPSYTWVVVAEVGAGASDPAIVLIYSNGSVSTWFGAWATTDPAHGVIMFGGTADTAAHAFEARFADGNNAFYVDGTEITTDAGTPGGFSDAALNNAFGLFFGNATIAFVACYPAATAPAGLVAGLITHYSI